MPTLLEAAELAEAGLEDAGHAARRGVGPRDVAVERCSGRRPTRTLCSKLGRGRARLLQQRLLLEDDRSTTTSDASSSSRHDGLHDGLASRISSHDRKIMIHAFNSAA